METKIYKLKKSAIPFMDEKYATDTKPMQYWKDCRISENALEEVIYPYITYGEMCGNTCYLSSWSRDNGMTDISFTLHIPQSHSEYKEYIKDSNIRELMKKIQACIQPLSQTDDAQQAKLDILKSALPNACLTIVDGKFLIQNPEGVIEYDSDFYEILNDHDIKPSDLCFSNILGIVLYEIDGFTKISDYGEFGEGIHIFNCTYCDNLTSLVGSPQKVSEYFSCSNCVKLTSLDGAPETVMGTFDCRGCDGLESLKGAPIEFKKLDCSECKNLKSLRGVRTTVGDIDYYGCPNLEI